MAFRNKNGANAFSGIGIHVRLSGAHEWTQESIATHMKTEAAKIPPNIWWHIEQKLGGVNYGNWGKLTSAFIRALGTAGACLFIALLSAGFYGALRPNHLFVNPALIESIMYLSIIGFVLASMFATACFTLMNVRIEGPGIWTKHDWHPHYGKVNNLVGSKLMVPPVAQAMAEKLLAQLPNTKFVVSKLEAKGHTGMFDPVLFAIEKSERGVVLHPMCAWNPDGSIVMPPTDQ